MQDFNDNPPGPTIAGNDLFAGPGASDPWHTTNYAFDGNGSRTAELGEPRDRAYSWDYRERLMAVKEGNKTLQTNEYDPYNRRVSMTANGERTLYVYEGRGVNNHVIYEYPANGKGTGTVNIWFGGRLVCSMTGDRESHYMADALGSVIALTNGSGAVVQRSFYEPFGKATVRGSSADNSVGFVGSLGVRHDESTGMEEMWNRYYDPNVSTFITRDYLFLDKYYQYVGNNPINDTDVMGLSGDRPSTPEGCIVKAQKREAILKERMDCKSMRKEDVVIEHTKNLLEFNNCMRRTTQKPTGGNDANAGGSFSGKP
jgi:RHS repeat-associated protein